MLFILLRVFAGFFFNSGGFYLAYLYYKDIDTGITPFLLLGAVVLVGVGVFFLIKAGESNASVMSEGKAIADTDTLQNTLKANEKVEEQWNKTSQLKTELDTIAISAEARSNPQ